jgi:hypothetical protein
MRPEINYIPESLGDILFSIWSVIPVDGYLLTAVAAAGVALICWMIRTGERVYAD